jgi:Fe-S-cluster containining protein
MPTKTIKLQYDCTKCPGYCCSYPRIEVNAADVKRLARHFDVDVEEAERRFTRRYTSDEGVERILRHQKDEIYGSICRFFDTDKRRCTVYAARPTVCRQYPAVAKCGYYEFLKFERKHQDDPDFVPLT